MRGRPVRSLIRQNLQEILYFLGEGYGYDLAKIYNQIFPKVTQRVIYYHLKKGVLLKEFSIYKIKKEKGTFSWGSTVEKIYYKLGKLAQPKGEKRVQEFIEKKKN